MLSSKGRATRASYLAAIAGIFCVTLLTGIVGGTVGQNPSYNIITIGVYVIWFIGSVVVLFSFGARRLHDFDRSAWWLLLFLIPYVNIVVLIALAVIPGNPRTNPFGDPAAA